MLHFLKSNFTILYPWKVLYLSFSYRQKNRLKMLLAFRMGV